MELSEKTDLSLPPKKRRKLGEKEAEETVESVVRAAIEMMGVEETEGFNGTENGIVENKDMRDWLDQQEAEMEGPRPCDLVSLSL